MFAYTPSYAQTAFDYAPADVPGILRRPSFSASSHSGSRSSRRVSFADEAPPIRRRRSSMPSVSRDFSFNSEASYGSGNRRRRNSSSQNTRRRRSSAERRIEEEFRRADRKRQLRKEKERRDVEQRRREEEKKRERRDSKKRTEKKRSSRTKESSRRREGSGNVDMTNAEAARMGFLPTSTRRRRRRPH